MEYLILYLLVRTQKTTLLFACLPWNHLRVLFMTHDIIVLPTLHCFPPSRERVGLRRLQILLCIYSYIPSLGPRDYANILRRFSMTLYKVFLLLNQPPEGCHLTIVLMSKLRD
jgi:hypothetical protein